MELNVREEKLKGLFKQFQVEHNENCKTVFIDNNDESFEYNERGFVNKNFKYNDMNSFQFPYIAEEDLYYIANIQDKFQTITQRTKYVSHIDASLLPSQMYFPVIPNYQLSPTHSE